MRKFRLLVLVLLSSLAVSCSTDSSPGPFTYTPSYEGNVSTLFGSLGTARKTATDISTPNFHWKDKDGRLDSIGGQRGKVVLLNFWATWCEPCKIEMPDLESIHKQYGDSVVVIGVATDYPGNSFETARKYVNTQGYTYQVVVDSNYALWKRYVPSGSFRIPITFVIDTLGRARFQIESRQTKQEFLDYIKRVKN